MISQEELDLRNSLSHHGILGQKWGVRRTEAQLAQTRNSSDKDIKRQRKKTSAVRRHLSEGDLKKAVERLQTEKKLKDLTADDIAPGRTAVKKALTQIGKTAVTAAATGVATYAIRAALEGKFDVKTAATFIRPKK